MDLYKLTGLNWYLFHRTVQSSFAVFFILQYSIQWLQHKCLTALKINSTRTFHKLSHVSIDKSEY